MQYETCTNCICNSVHYTANLHVSKIKCGVTSFYIFYKIICLLFPENYSLVINFMGSTKISVIDLVQKVTEA
jgi:hypothetical protein